MSEARSLYIDLLKKCLTGSLYNPRAGNRLISRAVCAARLQQANEVFKSYLDAHNLTAESCFDPGRATELVPDSLAATLHYMHRDTSPDTMSDLPSLDNLQFCVEEVIRNGIPGDLIETGIWKGGLPIFMRGILKAYEITDRVVWGADSFAGLPTPDPEKNLDDAIFNFLIEPLEGLKITYEFVESTFQKYGLLDEQVKFLRGWFSDTLPNAPIQRLAVLRLDGDWYESTKCSLNALYPKLSPGGFVIIDDYGLPTGCKKAVDEYRQMHLIDTPITWVNHQAVYWRKA